MTDKPYIVIVSSSNTKPSSLIKLITKSNDVKISNSNEATTHPWTIDTKYYSAEVNLIGITEDYQRCEKFNERVEALVIHMDSNKESGLDDLKMWEGIETDCNPEVKLLLANYCTCDTKVTAEKALEWCLKNGYEFIELFPSKTNKGDEEEIIKEKVGVERVIEALEAHTWPNLVMKEMTKPTFNKNDMDVGTEAIEECMKLVSSCEELLTGDGLDEFNDLFSQLSMMRDSLQAMPSSQKKHCAEQMVTAFWKAIGGEEEELTDL